MAKGITSTEGFVRKIFKVPANSDELLFYRGHSDAAYTLVPSVFRTDQLKASEHNLYQEMLLANPQDFSGDSSTLEKLARMQHHSLPTRAMDISCNPLMELFFSCKSKPHNTGEVIVIKVKKEEVKYFDSDTGSCLSNLARLTSDDRANIDTTSTQAAFAASPEAARLLHFIKEEKPYFANVMEPSDFDRVICVRSKMSNKRIQSQAGAFLLFGLKQDLQSASVGSITTETIFIDSVAKAKILDELDRLGINDSSVFPYIENSARYISSKYGA